MTSVPVIAEPRSESRNIATICDLLRPHQPSHKYVVDRMLSVSGSSSLILERMGVAVYPWPKCIHPNPKLCPSTPSVDGICEAAAFDAS